jgi:hypothetical protein
MFFESAKSIPLIVSALFPLVNPIGGRRCVCSANEPASPASALLRVSLR